MVAHAWLIRAGREDEYAAEAFDHNVVALGWRSVGDLTAHRTIAAVNTAVNAAYPEFTARARQEFAGQLYAFRCAVNIGDYVILLRSNAPDVAIGVVIGDYRFVPEFRGPHVRAMRWERSEVRRTEIGSDLLTGPALTNIYQVKAPDAARRLAALLSDVPAAPTTGTAVTTPVASMTALENLHRNLDYSRSLSTAGHHLQELKVELFEVSDVFRAAWVQAVAALDHWVRQEVKERMLVLAEQPESVRPAKFQSFSLPVALVDQVATGRLTLRQAIDTHYDVEMARTTFQGPQQIQDGFSYVADVKNLWGRVATVLTQRSGGENVETAVGVQGRLKEIVFRRNKIAHEYDEDPDRAPAKRSINTTAASQTVNFIGELAEAVVAVLDGKA